MYLYYQPSEKKIYQWIEERRDQPLSYSPPGLSRTYEAPPGFLTLQKSGTIGWGKEAFHRGCRALLKWKMYSPTWCRIFWPPNQPFEEGALFATLIYHIGDFHSLNFGRILYFIDEEREKKNCYGFGFGTLPDHLESGEEKFLLSWDRETGEVCYEVFSFSRPNDLLTWMGFPLTRLFQKQFCRESLRNMKRAVSSGGQNLS